MIAALSVPSLLRSAAALASTRWDPHGCNVGDILDRVAPTVGRPDGIDLWDAVAHHLGGRRRIGPWERQSGRTRTEVASMLRTAAQQAEATR